MLSPIRIAIAVTTLAIATPRFAAADIILDYSFAGGTIFDVGGSRYVPAARAAVDAAASDLSNALDLTNLASLSLPGEYVGTSTNASTTFNYEQRFTNPVTDATETFSGTLGQGEIRVFVGTRVLGGSTLGQGGPGGAAAGISNSGFPGGDFEGSAANAAAIASAALSRGGGPLIRSFVSGDNTIETGSTVGNLWFDNDTDNSGGIDDLTTLDENWHYDHTVPVASGQNDLYSVALHEILHSIGIGTSEGWTNLLSGTNWLGAQVIAENGTGNNLIEADGGHIAAGTTSFVIGTSTMQEVVMDPNITVGTRKFLTDLDVAFLRDIGVQSAATAVPEPTSLAVLGFVGAGYVARRRRRAA